MQLAGGDEMMWDWAPWWHWLGMTGLWVAVIVAIVWGISRAFPTTPPSDPHRILDERLANGSIDIEEYRRLRDELGRRARPESHLRA